MHATRSAAHARDAGVSWSERQAVVDLASYQELERRYGIREQGLTRFQDGVL